jgi:hypothetical protein
VTERSHVQIVLPLAYPARLPKTDLMYGGKEY